jgi:hypothetical protein
MMPIEVRADTISPNVAVITLRTMYYVRLAMYFPLVFQQTTGSLTGMLTARNIASANLS